MLEALEDRAVPAFALRLSGSLIELDLGNNGTYATGTGSANPADDNKGFIYNTNNFTGTGGFQQSYSFEQGGNASTIVVYNPSPSNSFKTNHPTTVTDISSGSTLAAEVKSTVYGTAASGLQLDKTYSYEKDSNEVLVTVRVTNNSGSTFSQLEYQDNADVGDPTHDTSTTANTYFSDRLATGQVFPNQNSTKPFPYVMSIASNDPRAFATVVFVNNSIRNDPYLGVTAPVLVSGTPPDPAPPENYGVGISFLIGDVAPGQSAVFQYNIIGTPSVSSVLDQWGLATASQGACGLTNLSSSVQSDSRPLRYVYNATANFFPTTNTPAGSYTGNVTVTNISDLPLGANLNNQVTVVFRNLPAGVTVADVTGTTASGSPYVTATTGTLGVNETIRVPIALNNVSNVYMSTFFEDFPVEVWCGAFDPRAA